MCGHLGMLAPTLHPTVPHQREFCWLRQGRDELQHTPYVLEIAREPEAHAHNTKFVADVLLELLHRHAGIELLHIVAQAEQRCCAAGVAHATRAQRDIVCRRGVLDEGQWKHLARRLRGA